MRRFFPSVILGFALLQAMAFLPSSVAQTWYGPIVSRFQNEGYLDASVPFNASAPAKRAEFIWLIVQLRGGFAEPTSTEATFDDVPTGNAYFGAFEEAARDGWLTGARDCAGTHPCFAKPWDTINRAETAALIVRAFGLAHLPSPIPLPDVPHGAWYTDVMNAAAASCILQGDAETGLFHPDGLLNRAEMVAMLDRARKPAEYSACHEPEPASSSSTSSASSSSSAAREPEPPPAADLTLELITAQTRGDVLPRGTQALPVLRFKATAACRDDVLIESITVGHGGLGRRTDVQGVWARGDEKRLSRSQMLDVNDNTATLYFYEPFIIRACKDRLLEVMVNFHRDALAESRHHFTLETIEDIASNAQTVDGAFPFESGSFRLGSKQTGTIHIRYLPVEEAIETELMNAVIGRFALSIDNHEDQVVYRMHMENTGTAQDGDFMNLWIRGFGTRLSNFAQQTSHDGVTFTFDPPEPIEKEFAGEEFIYEVMADIVSGKGKDIRMQFRDESDIFAVGSLYGHGINGQLYGSMAKIEGRAARVRIFGSSVPLPGQYE